MRKEEKIDERKRLVSKELEEAITLETRIVNSLLQVDVENKRMECSNVRM